MPFTRTALATLLALTLTGPALAQTATEETTTEETTADDGLSTGTPVDADGETLGEAYVADTFGDWEKRCIRTDQPQDPCQIYQLIDDQDGNSVAEITLALLPEGQRAAAAATIMTPLETLLTEQLTMSVDGGAGKRYPFRFCTQQGCVSRIGVLEEDLAAFRAGNKATLRIVPAVAPDQEVLLDVSLSGFTAAYNSLSE